MADPARIYDTFGKSDLPNWTRCPSTHCERAEECRNPSECSGTGRAQRERELFKAIGGRPA